MIIKLKTKLKNYKFKWTDFLALGLAFGILCGTVFFTFSRDVSLPHHVWLNGLKHNVYARGDYVVFKLPDDKYVSGRRLVKLIMCAPGDRIRRVQDSIFCNEKWVCNVLKEDKNGNPLPQIYYDEIIPEDYYFLAGTHDRSYDSRYFGLISVDKIEKEVHSLEDVLGEWIGL